MVSTSFCLMPSTYSATSLPVVYSGDMHPAAQGQTVVAGDEFAFLALDEHHEAQFVAVAYYFQVVRAAFAHQHTPLTSGLSMCSQVSTVIWLV